MNPAYRAPFPRTPLSMHIQLICECWHDPKRRDDTMVGRRVDFARVWLANAIQQQQFTAARRARKGARR